MVSTVFSATPGGRRERQLGAGGGRSSRHRRQEGGGRPAGSLPRAIAASPDRSSAKRIRLSASSLRFSISRARALWRPRSSIWPAGHRFHLDDADLTRIGEWLEGG